MDLVPEASRGGAAEADFPKEPLGSQIPGLEQPPVPTDSPDGSPRLAGAGKEEAGAGQDLADDKWPPPRPRPLRVPPLSLGYGAFRRLGSSSREPPSPGPISAEQLRDGEASGVELLPWAAPGEPAPGTWAPVELQVDVRVKPVGGSRSPSPAPSTRFLTVPVPESPAFSRHASPAHPLLQRAPSPSGTRGRASPLAAVQTDRDPDAEDPASPAQERAGSPDFPTCGCRERALEEDVELLRRAGLDGQKLPRAITLIGLRMYIKSLRSALVVMAVFLAVSIVAIVALASRAEAQDWETSQAFCTANHATLLLLSHTQDFLSRYPVSKHSWVGARRGPQGWHWIDGMSLPPQLLPEEDQDTPDLNCGGLEEGRLMALDCSSPRPWVCAKGDE
ncbi:killer cell lectin-like receptor subfamily G member 2 isoform X2 [Castor canadensis]|uniref:Killer cell lectin-like receptor subfamily G member 2 isoform X2 n=1 Tax=Castor canadensis TaxID=51338 RepID=A0AC58LM90_CASCN